MSIPHHTPSTPTPAPSPVRAAASPADGAGDGASAAPDIVAALVAAFVPAFCDEVDFALTAVDDAPAPDGAGPPHRAKPSIAPGCVAIDVRTDPAEGEPTITGTVTCRWDEPNRPSEADTMVAQLLADQAVATMRIAGLARALHVQRVRTANLEEALATNREIGQAIGILMATDQITADQAFEQLRSASQHLHRKLREIAADVVQTGTLAGAAGYAQSR